MCETAEPAMKRYKMNAECKKKNTIDAIHPEVIDGMAK